jgi:acetylornithine deacetylase
MTETTERRAAEILKDLIRIPSFSQLSNRPVIELASQLLHAAHWHVAGESYRDASGTEKINLLATPPWQPAGKWPVDLAFVCHTDTVPFDAFWTNALEPVEAGGRIHGCGACDVKGFLACLLAALPALQPGQCAGSIALLLTADEEIGCIGVQHLLAQGRFSARNIVVGEPTSLHPARAGKGYCLAEIHVSGREAHSAHPDDGVSAICGAARMISALADYADSLRQKASTTEGIFSPPYTTLNIGTVQGGTAKNVIPGHCSFLLEWRPLPGEENFPADEARSIAGRLERETPGLHIAVNVLRQQPGFATLPDAPLVRHWQKLSDRAPVAISFSTEAPFVASLGANVIVAGPGDMHTAHSPREFVPVAELEECVRLLQALVASGGL